MVPIPVRALACIAALLASFASGGQPTGGLRPTATMNAETIRGEWRLAAMTIDGKPRALPRDPVATLAFGPDASATGRAWINRYFGSYETAEGGKLRYSYYASSWTVYQPPTTYTVYSTTLEMSLFTAPAGNLVWSAVVNSQSEMRASPQGSLEVGKVVSDALERARLLPPAPTR